MAIETFAALEFFAGSGLVGTGLAPDFKVLWANDNSAKKAKVFRANHPEVEFDPRAIQEVHGSELPSADLAWASFPCQDLSLAGNLSGMRKGTRSGLFWEWVRIVAELEQFGKRPTVLVAENVVGFVVAHKGNQLFPSF